MQLIEKLEEELQNLFNDGNYDDAVLLLENKLNNSENEDVLKNKAAYHLGRIHFYDNDLTKAMDYFKTALSHNNVDVYSRLYLGYITEKFGKVGEAVRIYSSCLETNPELQQINHRTQKLSLSLSSGDTFIDEVITGVEQKIKLEKNKCPLISIIILCYNKVEFTRKCLKALFANTSYSNYEVIVVDNASVDDTPGFLEAYGNKIKMIHSKKNLGFVGGNNEAFDYAEGEYLVFLNNDTEVTNNWLKHLYNTFILKPDAGAVGSMLIYPDGKLQEAGGVIFSDATGWNYGKGSEVIDSKYSFLREVDYCSGAALMVRKDLFDKHGRFDERFAPAYFEDTDLCFGIRKLGYKVYYCPLSKVVHHEGITAGTDLSKGFKKYQVLNTPKFVEKWGNELKKQYKPDPDLRYHFSNRKKGKRILIIDDIPPFPDRAAGALRHYHTLIQMLNLGYQVTYVHLMGREFTDESSKIYFDEFRMKGVEFFWFNYESWWQFRESEEVKEILSRLIESLELKFRKFDFIYIAFWYIADYFIDLIRKEIPATPIMVDTMDVHYLRELRQAELSNDKKLFASASETKRKELNLYAKADCITTVTENDRDILKKELPDKSIIILTDVHDAKETERTFNERKDFLFIGNFNHNPNEDAVFYFVEKIFPLIKKQINDAKFYVVGNKPSNKLKALACSDIIVTGWVPEVKPYLDQCRVSVVPLRFGAGNKGKVGETLSHGLPMVSTTIGAEGMGIVNEIHSYVADDPVKFAQYSIKLYTDENLWNEFSVKGKELISSQYSSDLMRKRLQYIMCYDSREAFKSNRALTFPNPPKVSIILVAYNQYEYTRKCLQSIKNFTDVNHEIILVDNNSTDKTVKSVKKEFPEVTVIENHTNAGFPAAVNQGINASMGKYVLLINNDTEVTEGWLKKMLDAAESEHKIGVVGPISNSVSGVQIDKNAEYETIDEMNTYAAEVAINNKNQIDFFPRVAFLCTLIKRKVIDSIGGLDERFSPGNFEDDDFCLRTQLAGFKTVIARDVFIHHYGSVSFKAEGNNKYFTRLETNKKIFINKWGADPEEIWLQGKTPNQRGIVYPINPNKFVEGMQRAMMHLGEKEYELALINLERLIEIFEKSARTGYENISKSDLLNLAGNAAMLGTDLQKAQFFFEQELLYEPNSSRACTGLADVFSAAEMYDEAKVMYEWAIKNDPNNQKAIDAVGKINSLLSQANSENELVEQQKNISK